MTQMMNLNRLIYFSAVMNTGSFTRAGERLGVTKAVVSQQIARLEQELGAALFIRTTRQVHPTEAGQALHVRSASILQQAEDAFGEVSAFVSEPAGTLRLTAPNDYGVSVVVPLVAEFSRLYPACRVELKFSDRRLEMESGELDFAIRLGWLTDSSLQAKAIGSFEQILVGIPGVCAMSGSEDDLAAIAKADFVANSALKDPFLLRLKNAAGRQVSVRMEAGLTIDSTPAVLAAVQAGAGLAVLPDFLVRDDLASGRLVQYLPDWALPDGGIHVVYPAARYRPAKVIEFVRMLSEAEKKRRRP